MIQEVIEKLQAEVESLHHELSVTLPEALEKAIAMGDLKENGDYHAALERQRFVQARLGHLTSRLTKLSQIDISRIPSDRVGLGSKVVVRDMDTKEEEILELVIPDTMGILVPEATYGLYKELGEKVEQWAQKVIYNGWKP